MVILPDYQGVGLGTRFLNAVASFYAQYDFLITTSAKNLIHALNKSDKWVLKRYNVAKRSKTGMKTLKKSNRKVKTATFKYVNNIQ